LLATVIPGLHRGQVDKSAIGQASLITAGAGSIVLLERLIG
jgi:hypothetical protein